jgi:hypothetical protein
VNSLVGTAELAFVVAPGNAAPPVAELEHALRGPVAERLDPALADQLLDPAAVICLRHVHVDVDLPVSAPLGDQTVRAWARQLAAGIRRAVDRDGQAVVFPDENCYWADLLADLAGGRAAAWYQQAHSGYWEKSQPEAVVDVLDRSGDPGGVLLRVAERYPQALAPVLCALPGPAAAAAARQVLGTGDEGDVALITAALAVADRLALWSGPRWSPAQVRSAGVRPAVADWRSTEALTASVVGVVGKLVRLRVLTAPARASGLRAELDGEASLSWLDPDVLVTGLSALRTAKTQPAADPPPATMRRRAAGPPPETPRADPEPAAGANETTFRESPASAARRPEAGEHLRDAEAPAGPVPRTSVRSGDAPDTGTETDPDASMVPAQGGVPVRAPDALVAGSVRLECLAADIARIVSDEQAALGTLGTRDAAALFLTATLSARFPRWCGDALVGPVIGRTVASWEIGSASGGFGEPAQPVDLRLPVRAGGEVPAVAADVVPQSASLDEGAGVLLLLRAVVDLRLPAVIRRAGDDPDIVPSALLAAARHLTAAAPTPAMAVFAGLVDAVSDPERLSALTVPWPTERCRALARELQAVLRAQGLDAEDLGSAHGVGALVAEAVLRAWRRWLGGLGRSSTGYLLTQFLRRPGQVEVEPRRVLVTLAPRPLDVVLEQAGYLLPLRGVGLLGGRDLVFRTEE